MTEPRDLSALADASPFPNTFREGVRAAISVIDQHIPSITDEIEEELTERAEQFGFSADGDVADLAIRTCHCGARIDGFYEYVDHLKEVLRV